MSDGMTDEKQKGNLMVLNEHVQRIPRIKTDKDKIPIVIKYMKFTLRKF